jgi:hypothetical protein
MISKAMVKKLQIHTLSHTKILTKNLFHLPFSLTLSTSSFFFCTYNQIEQINFILLVKKNKGTVKLEKKTQKQAKLIR